MITNPFGDTVSEKWFALRVKARAEKAVATVLSQRGFPEFLPVYRSRRQWSDRAKSIELPLFPGYVFCRFNPDYRLPLLTIPGVHHVVGIGRVPTPVDDAEMAALQAASVSGLQAEPWPFLKIGERLRLNDGPLAGVDGVLIQICKGYRLVLSVTMLNQSVAVEIERDWVTPLTGSGTAPPIRFATFHPENSSLSSTSA